MAKLTDYIDPATLQQLQDAFSRVAGTSLRVLDGDGEPVAEPSPAHEPAEQTSAVGRFFSEGIFGGKTTEAKSAGASSGPPVEAAILVGHAAVGRVAAPKAGRTPKPALEATVRLAANVFGRLCDRERQLHTRVEELATLYHLAEEFAAQADLQTVLDRVAQTVVQVLQAKACSIRLLSDNREELRVKAVAGFSAEYLGKGPILLTESQIDQEVLAAGKPFYVPDERTDPRVLYPAEARREGLVSALCAPLLYRGRAEGIIHVYTGEVHVFDWFEVSLLEAIAAQAAAAIVSARLHDEAVRGAEMQRQLRLAGEVQRRMIPPEGPRVPGFDIAATYVPCFELGGDFYDFIDLPPDNLGVAVCDVVGKGVRASLLMATIRASLRAHAKNVYSMSTVLAEVNANLCADTLTSDFATLFYGVIDYRQRRITYANAGHTPPLLFRGGEVCHLTTGGGVLGIDPDARFRHENFILEPGDVILACTDGLVEAMNFDDEAFGRERTEAAALAAIEAGRTADGIVKHVLWEMRRFAGLQTRFDDLTIIAVKVL